MKKNLALMLLTAAALAASAPAYADTAASTTSDPSIYHRNVPDTPIWRNREFWRAEKERSGLPNFWENTKGFFRKLNPGPALRDQRERYESRRTTGTAGTTTARVDSSETVR